MKRARHVARIDETRNTNKILVLKLKVKDHLGDLSVDVRIILERILEKWCSWVYPAQDRVQW